MKALTSLIKKLLSVFARPSARKTPKQWHPADHPDCILWSDFSEFKAGEKIGKVPGRVRNSTAPPTSQS